MTIDLNPTPQASGVDNPRSAEGVGSARSYTSLLGKRPIWRLRRAIFRAAYPYPVAYGFLCELRSFLHRTASLRTLYESGLDLGPLADPGESENPQLCTRTRSRIADMRSATENREWLSLADLQTYLEGWDKGAAWAAHEMDNQDSCKPSKS